MQEWDMCSHMAKSPLPSILTTVKVSVPPPAELGHRNSSVSIPGFNTNWKMKTPANHPVWQRANSTTKR